MSQTARVWILPVLLAATLIWGIVAFAMGINAIVKGDSETTFIEDHTPLGATIEVDTADIVASGAVVAVSSILISLTSLLVFIWTLRFHTQGSSRSRAIPITAALLLLITATLFASLVPYTVFVATRSARVFASIGGIPVNPGLLHTIENALGVSTKYSTYSYLRLLAIIPWITLVISSSALALLFVQWREHGALAHAEAYRLGDHDFVERAEADHRKNLQADA